MIIILINNWSKSNTPIRVIASSSKYFLQLNIPSLLKEWILVREIRLKNFSEYKKKTHVWNSNFTFAILRKFKINTFILLVLYNFWTKTSMGSPKLHVALHCLETESYSRWRGFALNIKALVLSITLTGKQYIKLKINNAGNLC